MFWIVVIISVVVCCCCCDWARGDQQQPPDGLFTFLVLPISTFPGPLGDGPLPGPILFLISDAMVRKALYQAVTVTVRATVGKN